MYNKKISNYEIEKNFYIVYPVLSILFIIILLITIGKENISRVDKPIVVLIIMIWQLIRNLIQRDKLRKKKEKVKENGKCYTGEIVKPIIHKKWFGLIKCYSLLISFSTSNR